MIKYTFNVGDKYGRLTVTATGFRLPKQDERSDRRRAGYVRLRHRQSGSRREPDLRFDPVLRLPPE